MTVSVIRLRVESAQQSFKTWLKRLLTFQIWPCKEIVQCGRKFWRKRLSRTNFEAIPRPTAPISIVMLPAAFTQRNNITITFALRRKIAYRVAEWRISNHGGQSMDGREKTADRRGGGNRGRADAFRYASGKAHYAFAAMAGLGMFAIAAAVFDLDGAQAKGSAVWLAPAGAFLVLIGLGLYWLKWRKPVLLVIGPEGLHLPAALAQPVAWGDIWRMSQTRRRISWMHELIILKVELARGLRPSYKRSLMTWPLVDGLIASKIGLRIPLQSLDADEVTILASVERFRPVQRVTP